MKTTDYKKGDVVLLIDGGRDKRFEYLGELPVHGVMAKAYKPLDGETEYATAEGAAGVFVPFTYKLSVEVVGMKWYKRVLQWWKASNRWKHFLRDPARRGMRRAFHYRRRAGNGGEGSPVRREG